MKRFHYVILLCLITLFQGCKSESWSAPEKTPEKELILSLGYMESTPCGESKGNVILVAQGGSGHYKFHSPQLGENHSGLFDNLSAGSYLFILSDEHGNADSLEVLVENEDGIVIESFTKSNPSFGMSDGSFRIRVKGGKPPYLYRIDDGLLQTGKVFKNLTKGVFKVSAMDSEGCVFTRSVELREKDEVIS